MNMFLRILKKDLKRKKTMNIILLLFVIMATMFAASSVNNIIAVMNGLDNYFEKANMSDHFIISLSKDPDAIADTLSEKPNVSDFRTEKQLVFHDNDLTRNGEKLDEFSSVGLALSIDNAQINYFDKDNEIIKSVPRGKAYLTGCILNGTNFESGDEIQLKIGDTELVLEYAGIGKDAFLGSDMMTNPRIIMNNEDYEKLAADEKAKENNSAAVFYVNGPDAKALESDLSDIPDTVLNFGISVIRTSYIMNTIVAGLLLIVSVCLILVSFVMLRFTISFTINEEFREIGGHEGSRTQKPLGKRTLPGEVSGYRGNRRGHRLLPQHTLRKYAAQFSQQKNVPWQRQLRCGGYPVQSCGSSRDPGVLLEMYTKDKEALPHRCREKRSDRREIQKEGTAQTGKEQAWRHGLPCTQ